MILYNCGGLFPWTWAFGPRPPIYLYSCLMLIPHVMSHQLKKEKKRKKKCQHFCGPCLLPPNPTTHHSPPLIFTLTICSLWPVHSFHSFSFFFFFFILSYGPLYSHSLHRCFHTTIFHRHSPARSPENFCEPINTFTSLFWGKNFLDRKSVV